MEKIELINSSIDDLYKNNNIHNKKQKMPNWCENSLDITGDSSDIKTLVDCELSFQKLHPCPFIDTDGNSHDGWLDWCLDNWGTKWNRSEHSVCYSFEEETPTKVSFELLTAWSPCREILQYLTEKMPSLNIVHRYYECGMDFAGECHYKNGVMSEIEVNQTDFIREYFNDEYGDETDDNENEV